MRYELNDYNRGITEEELLSDLRAVAARVTGGLSQPRYQKGFAGTSRARR